MQVTFKDVISGDSEELTGCDVYAIPLTDKNGVGIKFTDSFHLRTQVEFISISGDFSLSASDNKTACVFGMGIGQTSDAHDTSNHYIGHGMCIQTASSGDPKFKPLKYWTDGANSHASARTGTAAGAVQKHVVTDFYVGPCVGGTARDTDTVWTVPWQGQNASGSYARYNVSAEHKELTPATGVFDVDTQVYLYAYFGSWHATDGSNDPAVMTVKMRYMVASNIGREGSGAA
jgi:hypothetical protein